MLLFLLFAENSKGTLCEEGGEFVPSARVGKDEFLTACSSDKLEFWLL